MDPASGLQSDFEHMQHASWVQGMSEAIKKGLLLIGFVGCRILVVSLIAYSKRYVIAFHVIAFLLVALVEMPCTPVARRVAARPAKARRSRCPGAADGNCAVSLRLLEPRDWYTACRNKRTHVDMENLQSTDTYII